jgi:pectinesterase
MVIFIKDGSYKEKVRVDAACITLREESQKGTRIEYPQLNDDFNKQPDDLGRAVVNNNGDDLVLDSLTVANTAGVIGPQAFAVYGRADRTVIVNCGVLSYGADTVSLWKGDSGKYNHAHCNFRGAVDFVCPRGWCYVTNCTFYETKNTPTVSVVMTVEYSSDFVSWAAAVDGQNGITVTTTSANTTNNHVMVTIPAGAGRVFARLRGVPIS